MLLQLVGAIFLEGFRTLPLDVAWINLLSWIRFVVLVLVPALGLEYLSESAFLVVGMWCACNQELAKKQSIDDAIKAAAAKAAPIEEFPSFLKYERNGKGFRVLAFHYIFWHSHHLTSVFSFTLSIISCMSMFLFQ